MDAQEFLTVSFEFVAIVPLVLMVVDFVLRQVNRASAQDLDVVHEVTPNYKGWDYVQPGTDWQEWNCPLPVTTTYWRRADELLAKSIRELKKAASKEHIKNYGDMRKSELVEALLAAAS
jgi:hypothetical protein